MKDERPHVFGLTPETLRTTVESWDMPRRVAGQVLKWVYGRGVVDPAAMTDLAARDRGILAERLTFDAGHVLAHQLATDGTQKLLVDWVAPADAGGPARDRDGGGDDDADSTGISNAEAAPSTALPVLGATPGSGLETECVMIPTPQRKTACISSQVGCPVGCRFCASGLGGLDGNLTCGRIVEQVHRLGRLPDVGRISNVVFMGMGEPLANFRAVTDAIRIINADWGLGIGARRITVSTVGMPAAIRKLVAFDIPVTLALSLHAPNDDIRRQLIPWAEYATVAELMDACQEYFDRTGREITFEYLLLRHVNDRPDHARELAEITKRVRANVNLIRWNEVKGLPYDRPTTADVHTFQQVLRKHGVNTHIRASRGRDIAAACGQLRHEQRTATTTATAADGA